jgi:two-component system, cell cycle sensor histidine kinase and response regulator CckA
MMKMDKQNPLFHDFEEILSAANRSADLARQLLAFARKQTAHPEVLDANEIVNGMLSILKRLIGEDIDLAWEPGYNIGKVKMDPTQLDQIIANLVINSRDALAEGGKITIKTENITVDEAYCSDHLGAKPGDYLMISISDNGCGMGKEVVDHLFEPFFTTKGIGKGTGLGLAIVYGIVKQNEGYIHVDSQPGEGTTFRIYLKHVPENILEAGPKTMDIPRHEVMETVLIVEDEILILNLSKRILESLGYNVLIANHPKDAIQLAREYAGDIHLLLTDIVMPEMNGREISNRLLLLRPGLKCLFMSGYTDDVIAHHGVLDEGMNFIQKPFTVATLETRVREVLDQ